MTLKETALDGVAASIEVLRAIRNKLEGVIARKRVAGEDVIDERADRAAVNRRLADLRELEVEIEAATIVVSAPTPEEIAETRQLLIKVQELAVRDAMTEAGLDFLRETAVAARNAAAKAKV